MVNVEELEMTSNYAKYIKPRLEADEEFRAKYMKQRVEILLRKYQRDENFRAKQDERVKARNNRRYDEDEEFRERKKKAALERYYKKKAEKALKPTPAS